MTYHLKRKDLEITDANIVKKILKSTKYVTIALSMDNKPYLVSLSHGYDEKRNCIYFHCAGKGKRARGIYPNVMAEMLSLLKKRESRKIDVSKELSFIEKEFNAGRVSVVELQRGVEAKEFLQASPQTEDLN